jgi:hypothetical protein
MQSVLNPEMLLANRFIAKSFLADRLFVDRSIAACANRPLAPSLLDRRR